MWSELRVGCLGKMGVSAIATSSMGELIFCDAASKVIFVEKSSVAWCRRYCYFQASF